MNKKTLLETLHDHAAKYGSPKTVSEIASYLESLGRVWGGTNTQVLSEIASDLRDLADDQTI